MNRKEFREGLKELLNYHYAAPELAPTKKILEKLGFDFSGEEPDKRAYDIISNEFYDEGYSNGEARADLDF